jgi:YidC/Oxa1 family membrane protein insertase
LENVRLVLFAALGMVLFLLWQAWQQDYGHTATTPPAQAAAPLQGTPPAAQPDVPAAPAVVGATPAATAEQPLSPDGPVAAAGAAGSARVEVRTDVLRVEIDTAGGTIRRLDLPGYPADIDRPETPFRLMGEGDGLVFLAQSGLISQGPAPTHHAVFQSERSEYVLADGEDSVAVPLRWTSPEGITVTKIYTFRRDSYLVDLEFLIENGSASPWRGRPYGQLVRNRPPETSMLFAYTYTGGVLHTEQIRYDKVDFDRMLKGPVTVDDRGGWVAMIQHYFGAAFIPEQDAPTHLYARALDPSRFLVGVVEPEVVIEPGATGRLHLQLYAGPKVQQRLTAAAPGLQLLVDYGYLTILAEPLFWLLQQIDRFVGNWGWSIVILTILIKLAFFHLSATSYRSMARMRNLQPRLVALKDRYGDDRAKLNQAMMELYRTEKVNPLGGCLPILVQIPVFIALYWVLLESVELRQAPFILWIRDLSVYDPYFVLPLLMGITMVVQQRLNPAPLDPIQQKVMMVLPVVFTVFFLFFPAGLVLYWLVNNTLSILQQWVITRRLVKDPAA